MIYLKWVSLVILDILSLCSVPIAVPILSLFTRARPDLNEYGKPWGWIYGTWDNPPQGDDKWQRECWFPHVTTGWRGYLNRVGWLFINPCYGYQKMAGIDWNESNIISFTGDETISDKHKRAGSYFATVHTTSGKLIAFEYYLVRPWANNTECLRLRIGWKIMTDKYERYGFATLVDTVTPYKKYGKI